MAESESQTVHNSYRSLFEHARDAMFIMDGEGTILDANGSAVELVSLPPENLRGLPLQMLFSDAADALLLREQLEAKRLFHEFEVRLRRRDGGERWCLISAAARSNEEGRILGYHAIARDITERKHAEERLLHKAFHDPLTDLPNRALFMDRMRLALARCKRQPSRRCAVLFLDLDDFKHVNDSFGHAAGDDLLVQVGSSLVASIRDEDTVARIGGDEFAILLETVDTDLYPTSVADRILNGFLSPFTVEGKHVRISASIGIALPESLEQAPAEILRNADIAMYRAKGAGAARYCVFVPEGASAAAVIDIESELRAAVANDELVLHYQPVVDTAGGRIAGLEALVRWQHPQRGLLHPAEFLEIAEQTGTIVDIGWWILREACARGRALLDAYEPDWVPYISVNISPAQLALPDLKEQLAGILNETRLPANNLMLEVRETALSRSFAAAVANLRRVRELGVRICVDNVATPQRSAAYLQIFPVDAVKIDRSFIARLTPDTEPFELVRYIVDQAARLRVTTIATGVETPDQLTLARRAGALHAQGFLFSPPIDRQATDVMFERDAARDRTVQRAVARPAGIRPAGAS